MSKDETNYVKVHFIYALSLRHRDMRINLNDLQCPSDSRHIGNKIKVDTFHEFIEFHSVQFIVSLIDMNNLKIKIHEARNDKNAFCFLWNCLHLKGSVFIRCQFFL